MKQKAFFIIFEGLLLNQIRKKFLEGESPTLKFTLLLLLVLFLLLLLLSS